MRHSYKKSLEKLEKFALSMGFLEVRFDHDNVSTIRWHLRSVNEPRRILIEGVHTLELKTYLLLHELGHNELRKDWDWFSKMFPIISKAEDHTALDYSPKFRRRKSYYVACLEEEYCAWNEGERLAKEFKIPINYERWDKLKSDCLMSYLRTYSNYRVG